MLDQLNTQITGLLGPAGPLIVVAGLAALLILATIPMMLNARPESPYCCKSDPWEGEAKISTCA